MLHATAKNRPNPSKGPSVDTFGHSLKKDKKHRVITTPMRPPPLPASMIPAVTHTSHLGSTPITASATSTRPRPLFRVSVGSTTASNVITTAEKPLKRPPSPLLTTSLSKKMKVSPNCPICCGSYHLAKDCPLVRKGSQRCVGQAVNAFFSLFELKHFHSIQREIMRLEADLASAETVQILRPLLKKQKAREQLAASAGGSRSGSGAGPSPIDISE